MVMVAIEFSRLCAYFRISSNEAPDGVVWMFWSAGIDAKH